MNRDIDTRTNICVSGYCSLSTSTQVNRFDFIFALNFNLKHKKNRNH
jgi:hypothetical protein